MRTYRVEIAFRMKIDADDEEDFQKFKFQHHHGTDLTSAVGTSTSIRPEPAPGAQHGCRNPHCSAPVLPTPATNVSKPVHLHQFPLV